MKGPLGLDVAGGLGDGENAITNIPFRRLRAVLRGDPFVQIFTIEENDRVGGRLAAFSAGVTTLGSGVQTSVSSGLGCWAWRDIVIAVRMVNTSRMRIVQKSIQRNGFASQAVLEETDRPVVKR